MLFRSEFMKRYLQQHRVHSDLLANFERDLGRLRSIKLHPQLQTATRKCLLDFVKEDHLRKMAENCSNSHRQFENKVSQFKQMFGEMKRKVEDLFSSKSAIPVRNLELMIKEHQRYINEEKSIMQSLRFEFLYLNGLGGIIFGFSNHFGLPAVVLGF